MELIELYTQAVGRELPEKMRADIEKEIRSLIEDTLEDEAEKAGRPVDEALVVEVLTRMGPPEKVAASYLPPRYLIGPELFPHYLNTLRVVLAVAVVVAALAVGVGVGARAPELSLGQVIGEVVGGMINILIQATGVVTLVFAMIQFFSPDLKLDEAAWNPRDLRAEPDPERVHVPGAIAEIVFNVLALVVFNLYPQWIGIASFLNGEWVHAPMLTEAFFRYLPILSVVWAAEAGLNVWLIARGRWSTVLRWFSVAVMVAQIAVLAWIISGPPVVAITVETLSRLGSGVLTPELALQISQGVWTAVRLGIGLVIALEVVELGKQMFKLLRPRLPDPVVIR